MEPFAKLPNSSKYYKDVDSTPFNSYVKSLHLSKNIQPIIRSLTSPQTSWRSQHYITNLMLNSMNNQKEFQLLCFKAGYITSDGDWQLPKFCEINVLNRRYPTFQGIAFSSQSLIEKIHSIDLPPCFEIIKELFLVAQRTCIPWHFPKACSQGNTFFLYATFTAMGISSRWMKKYYCFGKLDRATHRKDYHTALSIQDHLGNFWILDPSVANKPLRLFRWAALFVPNVTLPIKSLFPCIRRRNRNHIFQVEGNDLLTFKEHFEAGTYKISLKSFVNNISSFAAQYTSKIIEHTILANVMKYPAENKILCHNEALDKVICFIKNSVSILPLPEDIQSIQPDLIFKRRKILNIALDFKNNPQFKSIAINKIKFEIISSAKLICKLLMLCKSKLESLDDFPEDEKLLISSWIDKKVTSINFFKFSFNHFVQSTLANLPKSENPLQV